MDEPLKTYVEFNGVASDAWVVVESSMHGPHECFLQAGTQGFYLSVADARALIDGLLAFAEGAES